MEVEITPTTRELLSIVGCLWAELDQLRERVAQNPISFNKRTFTNSDIINGHSLGIKARVLRDGKIVVTTDS